MDCFPIVRGHLIAIDNRRIYRSCLAEDDITYAMSEYDGDISGGSIDVYHRHQFSNVKNRAFAFKKRV